MFTEKIRYSPEPYFFIPKVMPSPKNKPKKLIQEPYKGMKILVENFGDDKKMKKMVVSNMEGFRVVEINHVIRLEGDRNYTHFILSGNKKITASKTLSDYEDLLLDHGFFRIHQSTIINLRHVCAYIKGDGGTVEMSDGKNFQVSRHRKQDFLKRFIG